MSDDYYKILNVARTATTNEIKKAYLKKIRECHPDKNNNSPESIELTQKVNAAWDILSNPAQRTRYDNASRARATASPRTAPSPHAASETKPGTTNTAKTPPNRRKSTQHQRSASESKPTAFDGVEIDFISLSKYRKTNPSCTLNNKKFTGNWPTYGHQYNSIFIGAKVSNCDITAIFTSFCHKYRGDFISGVLKSFTDTSVMQKGCFITSDSAATGVMIMLRLILNNADIHQLNWDKMPPAVAAEKNQWSAIQKRLINYRNKLTTKNTPSSLSERNEIDRRLLELASTNPTPESATEFVLRLKHSACSCCGGLFAARPACYKLAKLIEKDAGYKNKPSSRKPRQNNR